MTPDEQRDAKALDAIEADLKFTIGHANGVSAANVAAVRLQALRRLRASSAAKPEPTRKPYARPVLRELPSDVVDAFERLHARARKSAPHLMTTLNAMREWFMDVHARWRMCEGAMEFDRGRLKEIGQLADRDDMDDPHGMATRLRQISAVLACPLGDSLHHHGDGCPSCTQASTGE